MASNTGESSATSDVRSEPISTTLVEESRTQASPLPLKRGEIGFNKSLLIISLLFTAALAQNNGYTYYVFASEWAGSICQENSCTYTNIPTNWFNIHGLWPTNAAGTGPENCTGPIFNPLALTQQTLAQMATYWSGLYSDDDTFYAHEWEKHGTCWQDSDGNQREEDFFTKALAVAHQVDVYAALATGGVTPRSEPYTYDDIKNALNTAFGDVMVQCQSDNLNEVQVCLDLKYNPMNCPNATISCNENIYYHPIEN
jgi:ribonuclease T2